MPRDVHSELAPFMEQVRALRAEVDETALAQLIDTYDEYVDLRERMEDARRRVFLRTMAAQYPKGHSGPHERLTAELVLERYRR
jgi:hypothetical protein